MQNNRIRGDESLKDYMGDASLSSGMMYINSRAQGINRYIAESGVHLLFSWFPGPLGMMIRSIFYKPLLHSNSKGPYAEANSEFFHMDSIRFGKSVYIDKLCRIHASRATIELGDNNRVMRGSYLSTYVSQAREGEGIVTGSNCFFGLNTIMGAGLGGIFIGDNTFLGANVSIISVKGYFQHDDETSDQTIVHDGKPVHIGSNVIIYSNAVIAAGVTIGDNAVVAASSFVTKDVAPYTMVGPLNNIARVISKIK